MQEVGRVELLEAIRRLTAEAGGRAPGKSLFLKLTGYRQTDWYGKYWARWGDALAEAGVDANVFNGKVDEKYLLEQLAAAIEEFGHFPTFAELRMLSKSKEGFPSHTTWSNHFRGRNLRSVFAAWVKSQGREAEFSNQILHVAPTESPPDSCGFEGWVYLLKSGSHYKIGRSDDIERRVKQISIALPQSIELIHAIRTDDPSGIEAYWHTRFSKQRKNGEWFNLETSDVKAFKRRKFQ